MSETKGNGLAPVLVRMPRDLRERLKQRADTERRTMNAQAVKFIEDGLRKQQEVA